MFALSFVISRHISAHDDLNRWTKAKVDACIIFKFMIKAIFFQNFRSEALDRGSRKIGDKKGCIN
jgi:hypothetical protein